MSFRPLDIILTVGKERTDTHRPPVDIITDIVEPSRAGGDNHRLLTERAQIIDRFAKQQQQSIAGLSVADCCETLNGMRQLAADEDDV